jgi:hypothetical protein
MELLALALIVFVIMIGWSLIDMACAAMSSRISQDEEDE